MFHKIDTKKFPKIPKNTLNYQKYNLPYLKLIEIEIKPTKSFDGTIKFLKIDFVEKTKYS